MRVLHLITTLERGGAETWLLSMLRTIPPEICQMDFCCKGVQEGSLAPEAKRLGARVFLNPLTPLHVGYARILTRILQEHAYDLVHNHLNAYAGFPVWVTRRLGIPVLTTFHATHFEANDIRLRFPVIRQLRSLYSLLSVRYAIAKSTVVSGVSQAVLDAHIPRSHQRKYPCRVLYLGTAPPPLPFPWERTCLREQRGLPPTAPLVLHVGSFLPVKNHRGVVEVFQRVRETIPEARLVLVGEGFLKPKIEQLVLARGLGKSVHFLGIRKDVSALMTLCDVFLFPSLNEGFPVSILEAQAAGLPIVGSQIPALIEAVEEGKTAILHPIRDTAGMAASVIRILTDAELASHMGRAGRVRVEQLFSISAAAERLLNLYREVLRYS